MSHRVIFLWSVPRSVSTSFERMMMARGDHTVFDEPFSRSYYYGPDRRSSRFSESEPDSSAEDVLETIEKAALERPVFVKDMAYQAAKLLGCRPVGALRELFPRPRPRGDVALAGTALARLHRRRERLEAPRRGSTHHRLARAAAGGPGCEHPLRHSAEVVEEWCERMSLPYDRDALTWEPGMQPEWEHWGEWHASTARRSGFSELRDPPPPPTPDEPRLHEAYQEALPVYERFLADAIGAERRRARRCATSPGQVRRKVVDDLSRVVLDAMDERGLAAPQHRQAERIESRAVDHSAVVSELALRVDDRYVEPRVVGPIAGRPHHRADLATLQIELQAR